LQIVTADLHFRTAPATTVFVGSGKGNNVLKDHSQPPISRDRSLWCKIRASATSARTPIHPAHNYASRSTCRRRRRNVVVGDGAACTANLSR